MIKDILIYAALFVVSLGVGVGATKLYHKVTEPPSHIEGDFTQYGVAKDQPVVLFTTETCIFCQKLLAYLDDNNVKYLEHKIDKDNAAMEMYRKLEMSATPVVIIENNLYVGFQKENIESDLKGLGLLKS